MPFPGKKKDRLVLPTDIEYPEPVCLWRHVIELYYQQASAGIGRAITLLTVAGVFVAVLFIYFCGKGRLFMDRRIFLRRSNDRS